jgi:DNA-directed RNA polymerase subunit RPC12/RpoP
MSTEKGNRGPELPVIFIFHTTAGPAQPLPRAMWWYCMDCRRRFMGPTNRAPDKGCQKCGGRNIFDCNVAPVKPVKLLNGAN